MKHEHETHSLTELIDPVHLAIGAVALAAFCVADVLWRVLPLIQ